ncbi:hypothetical protein RB213_015291 [Colletotrichum asianum]
MQGTPKVHKSDLEPQGREFYENYKHAWKRLHLAVLCSAGALFRTGPESAPLTPKVTKAGGTDSVDASGLEAWRG